MRLNPFSGRKAEAFTLIELMAVIAIMGIMTAMILPEMRGTFEDALLRSTSRDLVSVFELASSRAISLNQLHRVRLDTAAGRYQVECQESSSALERYVPLREVAGCQGIWDTRISVEIHRPERNTQAQTEPDALPIQTPDQSINFYPDGTADAALIQLEDRAGFRLGLELNPITAHVHVVQREKP